MDQLRKATKSALTAISFERLGNDEATETAARIAGEKCFRSGENLDSFHTLLQPHGIMQAALSWNYIVDGWHDAKEGKV